MVLDDLLTCFVEMQRSKFNTLSSSLAILNSERIMDSGVLDRDLVDLLFKYDLVEAAGGDSRGDHYVCITAKGRELYQEWQRANPTLVISYEKQK